MGPTLPSRFRQRGFWNFVIPAVATLAGAVIGGRSSAKGQEQANETNVGLSREQMRFQERMSGTAYQRGVADMKAAGLNPMLAYSQGGASAPTGSMATTQNTQAQMGANLSSSAGQAMQMISAIQQMEATQANTQLTAAAEAKTRSETMAHDLNSAKLIADTEYTRTQQKKTFEEILGASYDSQEKQMRYRANMGQDDPRIKGSSFAADAERRKSEAKTAKIYERTAESKAQIAKYGIDEAKAASQFYQNAESMPKWLQLIIQSFGAIRGLGR